MPRHAHLPAPCLVSLLLAALFFSFDAFSKVAIPTLFNLAEDSNVVFVGTPTRIDASTATLHVEEILSGSLPRKSVVVTPVTAPSCLGPETVFRLQEPMLIFGVASGGQPVLVGQDGLGAIPLPPAQKVSLISATRRLLSIAPLDPVSRDRAILAAATDPNPVLRREAGRYVSLSLSSRSGDYRTELIALIENQDPEIQQIGLQGLQFVPAPTALPRIISLTRSPDPAVVSQASLCLARYDTPESTAALIALTRHPDPSLRQRATIDLDRSKRPEALAALGQVLDDPDPRVRALAPRGLIYWLRDNKAGDLLPRLVALLDDPHPEVRASAARHLGECRDSSLVPPLLATLKKNPADASLSRSLLSALYLHYGKGDPAARQLIDSEIPLIAASLRAATPGDSRGAAFEAASLLNLSPRPEAREALQWAAASHPDPDIKTHARQYLENK